MPTTLPLLRLLLEPMPQPLLLLLLLLRLLTC
jgi:hypothetical protein